MILQRIVCLVVLIAAALVFVYSLGLLTDMYENKLGYHAEKYYTGGMTEEALAKVKVTGAEIYYDMQQFNRELTTAGLVLIILAVSQYVFQNQNRRKYYIANYITVGVNTLGAIYYSYWGLSNILSYKERYVTTLDFEKLKKLNEMYKFSYTESTFWFDAGKYVFGLLLVAAAINVGNMVWKICLMKNEQKLVQAGKEGKAA
jgi:multisubunit Na+/H+ antiporter MnhG subunit